MNAKDSADKIKKVGPRENVSNSAIDAASTVARAGVAAGLVHITTGVIPPEAAAFLSKLIDAQLAARTDEWKKKRLSKLTEAVSDRMAEAAKDGILTLETVTKDRDALETIILQALAIAEKNHQDQKLQALANALVNSMIESDVKVDKRLMFIRWIDELTPSHLKVLALADDVRNWIGPPVPATPSDWPPNLTAQNYLFPELRNDPHFHQVIIRDLSNRELISDDPINFLRYRTNSADLRNASTTDLGHEFCEYIRIQSLRWDATD